MTVLRMNAVFLKYLLFQERRPIKWLAPECYESMKNCTSMSDVWAFGVVIWEIFSTGKVATHIDR